MWRRQRILHTQHAPLTINGATVERVSSTKFLGVHITEDLSWTNNTAALAKKAQQRLYFLRKLRRARAPPPIMCTFYKGTIESILLAASLCGMAPATRVVRRIVRAAEKIVGVSLPSLQDIYSTRLTRKALSIAGDPTHPTHSFFSLLPSGRRLRSLQARTSRLKDSFIHQAVRKLNSLPSLQFVRHICYGKNNQKETATRGMFHKTISQAYFSNSDLLSLDLVSESRITIAQPQSLWQFILLN